MALRFLSSLFLAILVAACSPEYVETKSGVRVTGCLDRLGQHIDDGAQCHVLGGNRLKLCKSGSLIAAGMTCANGADCARYAACPF